MLLKRPHLSLITLSSLESILHSSAGHYLQCGTARDGRAVFQKQGRLYEEMRLFSAWIHGGFDPIRTVGESRFCCQLALSLSFSEGWFSQLVKK